jgi:hypothetical protein
MTTGLQSLTGDNRVSSVYRVAVREGRDNVR